MAKAKGSSAAAQLVAGECVVLAETKDHLNRELIGHLAEHRQGEETAALRELWIESLGLPAVLPPPEEVKKVETAIGAARAENLRETMLKSQH